MSLLCSDKLCLVLNLISLMCLFHRSHILLGFCFSRKRLQPMHYCVAVWISIFWNPSIWALCIPSASIFKCCLLWAWGLLVWLCQKLEAGKCVGECVYLQCYYSSLTVFALSSKSAGWCNKGVYLCAGCVCVYVRETLCSLYYACRSAMHYLAFVHPYVCVHFTVVYLTSSPPLPWSYCFHYQQHASHYCCLPTHMHIQYTRHTQKQNYADGGFSFLITSPSVIQG